MHDQSGWLIDHEHIGIDVQDVERDVLRQRTGLDAGDRRDTDRFAALDGIAGAPFFAIQQRVPRFDPLGQPRTREVGEHLGQCLVETLSGTGQRNRGFQQFDVVGSVCWGTGIFGDRQHGNLLG